VPASREALEVFLRASKDYLEEAKDLCSSFWVNFDDASILLGLAAAFAAIVAFIVCASASGPVLPTRLLPLLLLLCLAPPILSLTAGRELRDTCLTCVNVLFILLYTFCTKPALKLLCN
jgi:hypothetical protein